MALSRFVNIYTKIIKSERQRKFFNNMYYIDLMAGSGLCRIGKKGDIVAGSASIACTQCYNPFDEYFFVEKDPEKAKALEERIKTLTSNYNLFNCDCNDCIEPIVEEIPEKSHYLAFVDCEGLDVPWATMQKLFSKNGDVLINFQTTLIWRQPAKVKNHSVGWEKTEETLNRFFGDSRWKECEQADDLLNCYIVKIETKTSRNLVLPLPVIGDKSYRYDIILATRRTKGGSPWIKPMQQLQEKMGGYKPDMLRSILDILMHRQTSLTNSFASE